jgi:hypothetical protein
MATFEAPTTQNLAAIGGSGTGAEAMDSGPAAFLGLIGAFRHIVDTLQCSDYRV